MSLIITRPAALVKQGNLQLYSTSFPVRDLVSEGFYDIERLDPDNPDDKGYQRLLNKSRAKKLADYLVDGQANQDAFLPTSLFLATDKNIAFNPSNNTITFDVHEVGPFSVVDGQHRIEGFKIAAEKKAELLDFEVPVNIAINLPKIAQMCHFLIVNTTQKSVDKAVEQRIYARLAEDLEFENVPSLPKWIRRIVDSGDNELALRLVDYLNDTVGSPWHNKIEMANQDLKTATTNQRTFVKMIIRYVLTANNPVTVRSVEHQQRILLNYWKALANLLDTGKTTVLYKYIGVELFCRFSTPLFTRLQNNFQTSTMESMLKATFENMDGEYAGIGHPEWWFSGTGVAGGLNSTAVGKIHHDLTIALHKVQANSDITL